MKAIPPIRWSFAAVWASRRKASIARIPQVGDRVIVIGGRTGRDGLRGATFSSMTMDAQTGEVSGASVQIGDPITEKGLIDVIVRARDLGLYTDITDCGAGGLSSAVGEMASRIGGDVDLTQCPAQISRSGSVGNLAFRSAGAHGAGSPARKHRQPCKNYVTPSTPN